MNELSDKNGEIIVAAIQLEAVIGDVDVNLERVEGLCRQALAKKPRVLALPEFFTSRIAFDPQVHSAVLPPDNQALALMKDLASQHECWIGGSMLIADQGEVYNRYHFVEPDGVVHIHDKDLPTMWENNAYGPGDEGGAFETGLGGVGVAMCWELIRSQTVRRLKGKADIAITGTHWWTLPTNWGPLVDIGFAAIAQYNRYLSENAPSEFARRLGVPVVQASHCGSFRGGFQLLPGVAYNLPYDSEYVGCTQIVDSLGHVLAQRQASEGPGFVTAKVKVGNVEPACPTEDRFWIPSLPLFLKLYWYQQNLCGRVYYRAKGRQAGLKAALTGDIP